LGQEDLPGGPWWCPGRGMFILIVFVVSFSVKELSINRYNFVTEGVQRLCF